MADTAPRTQNWNAWQDLQPGPDGPRLIVTAQVEISNTNQTPHLREHHPPGINSTILQLDLTMTTSGVGNTVVTWRDVRFTKGIRKDQYSTVEILWEKTRIAQLDVADVN
jgi:hypothetical protein